MNKRGLEPHRVEMESVGFVRVRGEPGKEAVSELVLREELVEALGGVEEFSHLFVIYWMNRIPRDEWRGRVHPRGRQDLPLVGLYATRTPYRPNPVGLTLVELLERRGSVLKVKGLDALDGTPILDIKPFDYWDMRSEIRVPSWWLKLQMEAGKGETDRV